MKCLVVVAALCVAVTGFARPGAAQDVAKVEVSGGWNYYALKDNAGEEWTHIPKGWYADVAVALNPMWAAVGQVSGGYKTLTESDGDFDVKIHPYLFGIRASSRRNPKATAFAQFLAGAARISISQGSDSVSKTYFSWQAGGGANVIVNERVSARVGADYVRVKGSTDSPQIVDDALQGLRLSVGLVFGFGAR